MLKKLEHILDLQESIKVISHIFNNEMDSAVQLKLMTDVKYYQKLSRVIEENLSSSDTTLLDFMFDPTRNSTPSNFQKIAFNHLFEMENSDHIFHTLKLLEKVEVEGIPSEKMNSFKNIAEFICRGYGNSNTVTEKQFFEALSDIGHAHLPVKIGEEIFSANFEHFEALFSIDSMAYKNIAASFENPDSKALMQKYINLPENEDVKEFLQENMLKLETNIENGARNYKTLQKLSALYENAFNFETDSPPQKPNATVKPKHS